MERDLPEGHAESEDVRAPIDFVPEDLLGRQVRELSLDDSDGRRRHAVTGLREPEVDELGYPRRP